MARIPQTLMNPSMGVAASALRAQQARMRVIAENIANADSTAQTPGGQPYRRQVPVFEPERTGRSEVGGVRMTGVRPDMSAMRQEYDPNHPGADAQGYVLLLNVESLVEALDMREAQRAYEANLNVIQTARSMDQHLLDILKK